MKLQTSSIPTDVHSHYWEARRKTNQTYEYIYKDWQLPLSSICLCTRTLSFIARGIFCATKTVCDIVIRYIIY